MPRKIVKSESEWRKQLTPQQYEVCRRKGTEAPFTGRYHDCKDDGIYRCACCGADLFDSETKYDSGTGWPSFYEPIAPDQVREQEDRSLGTTRIEVLCSGCDCHLGHVFEDGPRPTGRRYCINSAALDLAPRP